VTSALAWDYGQRRLVHGRKRSLGGKAAAAAVAAAGVAAAAGSPIKHQLAYMSGIMEDLRVCARACSW